MSNRSSIIGTSRKCSKSRTIPEVLWHDFTPLLQAKIAEEYELLREKNRLLGKYSISEKEDLQLWMEAYFQYMIKDPRPSLSKRSWACDNINGVMVIAAILAIAFGIMGAWGLSSVHIATLFAGTLVGATVMSKR
jgi:hypothetical protein